LGHTTGTVLEVASWVFLAMGLGIFAWAIWDWRAAEATERFVAPRSISRRISAALLMVGPWLVSTIFATIVEHVYP
jgi:hypothetical protein